MPINVVLIDDEPLLCENFYDLFNSDEIKIKTFSDVNAAVEDIAQNPPDIIFLDYRLPGTTGDELAFKLDPKIPKYLITGDLTVVTKYKFIKIFTKPYSIDEIMQAIMGR